jgi:hypothetical protein
MEATAAAQPADKRNGYTDDDFAPFRGHDAKLTPPNFEEMPIDELAALLTFGGIRADPYASYVIPPGQSRRVWARWFYCTGQSGGLTGEGYVIWYCSGPKPNPRPEAAYAAYARGGRFAICKHEKVDGPGANHSRGWHPGHCRLCGLDMTVDSGD